MTFDYEWDPLDFICFTHCRGISTRASNNVGLIIFDMALARCTFYSNCYMHVVSQSLEQRLETVCRAA